MDQIMRKLLLWFCLYCIGYVNAQEKPVYISKTQEGNNIILKAHNDLDQAVRITLNIKSKGMNLSAGPKIIKAMPANSVVRLVTMAPVPGMQASYSYKLSSEILDPEEAVEIVRQFTEQRVIVKNSSRHREKQALENVDNNLPTDQVIVFIKEDCERCIELLDELKRNNINFTRYETGNEDETEQLMWDALLAYGVKEGKVLMPVVFYKEEVYYDIDEVATIIPNLKK